MRWLFAFLVACGGVLPLPGQQKDPLDDPSFFPIAVWLQDPKRADEFKAAGINTYVGLWRGPTDEQLKTLQKAGMKLVCSQNSVGLQNKDNPLIIAWMHGDEPDNAQSLKTGPGYGPPILPEVIYRNYLKIHEADPSRPVLLNLGQGVAWDNYIGRGVRRNHPEDYPEYLKGCDIASFDIYPAVHDNKEIAGHLEYVAQGVERLKNWTQGKKKIWNCIECTRISNVKVKPTPEQVRSEVWMSLIHGSQGLIYFIHQFKPEFREAALLDDPEMVRVVTALNKQIRELAPVLNSPTVEGLVQSELANPDLPIATMTKKANDGFYLFTVAMRNTPTRAKFKITSGIKNVEVLGEARELKITSGTFEDEFPAYGVHLYKMK